jgi:hypothetical protein
MVTWTVLVNGSAFSSQTFRSRSVALRWPGLARRSASSTSNSLSERWRARPSRVTLRRKGSSSMPAARSVWLCAVGASSLRPARRLLVLFALGALELVDELLGLDRSDGRER